MGNVSLIEILDDMASSIISSKYSKHFLIIGGFALLSRYKDAFRRTIDIDIHADKLDIWNEFVKEVEELLTCNSNYKLEYKLVKRTGLRENKKSESLRLEVAGYKVKIDMNIEQGIPTVPITSIITNTKFQTTTIERVLSDKLNVLFSKVLVKRFKDTFDIVYIAMNSDFVMSNLLERVELKNPECNLENIFNTEYLKDRYSKFEDISSKLDLSFQQYYDTLYNFAIPIYYSLKYGISGKELVWDKKQRVWKMEV
jgi:hypothetical protein